MSEKAIDYFISYPKSGRTWVRFMYLTYLELHFGLTTKNVFETEANLIYYWQPRWVHLGADPDEGNYFYSIGNINFKHLQNSSCIWMTRNIYDTLVSLYYHARYRSKIKYPNTLSEFIRDPKHGVLKICCFYAAMHDNMRKVMRISYEEMQKDRSIVLLKLLHYVKLKPNEKYIKIAVEKSSFKNMKKFGNSYKYKNTLLAPMDEDNLDSYKVRIAEPGNFKKELSNEDIEYINDIAHIILPNNKEILKWN